MTKEVQIVISARDAASQVLNQVGDAAEKNARRLASLGTSLGNVGRQMSTWVTLPAIAASAAIIKFGGEVMRTENYFRTALGDMAEEAREWADEIQDKFSFDDDDLKRDLADLMTMFDQMGVRSQQAALQMSQSLVMAARSMALLRGSGADVPQILDAMQAALMGNVRGLRRYGMDLDEAAVKSYAYKSGLAAWGSELTKGQALLARFGLIMQATKRDQEALGQSLQSPAGQLYVMQQQLQDTTDELATAFLPALLAVISAAKPVLQTIRDLAQGFKDLPPNVQQGVLWFVAFIAILGPVVSAISNVVKFVGYLKAAVAGVGITGAATAPAIVALIAVIGALGYAAYKAMTDWEGFKHFWQTLWHYIVDLVLTGATKALQILDKFLGWIPGMREKLHGALADVYKTQIQINNAWAEAEKKFQATRKKKPVWDGQQEQPTIPGLNLNLDLDALRAQLGSLGGLMEGSTAKIRTAKDVLNDWAKALAQAARMQDLLGAEFDATGAQVQAYRRAIEDLVEIDPKNPRLPELVQNYQRLAAAQKIAADTQNLLNAARNTETQWAQRNMSDLQRQAAELRAQAAKDKENAAELLRHAAELERIDAAQKAEAIVSARKDLTDKIKQLTLSERDYQLWALDQERAAFEATYKDNADMLALFAEYYKAKWQEIINATPQTFAEGWRAGIQEAIDELGDWGKHAKDIATDTAQAMQTAFSDYFFDAFTGQLKSLQDYTTNLINSILRSISNALASMFTSFLMSWFGGFPAYGSGGTVRAGEPVWVGDRGRRELFVPAVDGRIIPEERLIASMSPAAAAGAISVEVHLINQGGGEMQLTRQETKVDWPRVIVTAWMEAVTRNIAGSRDFATALARG